MQCMEIDIIQETVVPSLMNLIKNEESCFGLKLSQTHPFLTYKVFKQTSSNMSQGPALLMLCWTSRTLFFTLLAKRLHSHFTHCDSVD